MKALSISGEAHSERGDGERDFQFPALRPSDLTAIAALGLQVEDFLYFRHTFVGSPWTYAIRHPEGDWSLRRDRPITTPLLLAHLRGDLWIATGAKKNAQTRKFITPWIAVDLDQSDSDSDLYRRYDSVQDALGRPSLVFRSSAHGGLHVYYLLDDLVNLHRLRMPSGESGAAMHLLAREGLRESSGRVEVYPRGNYMLRGIQNRLRLPFGGGSRLLDRESLLPMVTRSRPLSDLTFLREHSASGRIETIDSKSLLSRGWSLQALPTPRIRSRASSPTRAPQEDIDRRSHYVEKLRVDGLTDGHEFNKAVSALAFDGLWNRATLEETIADICQWLADGFHNNLSITYTTARDSARREIDQTVRRIFARNRPSWGPLPPLSVTEIDRILNATSAGPVFDPATGEELNRFKVQRFAFDLTRRAKQFIVASGQRLLTKANASVNSLETTSAIIADLWPDPSRAVFRVACPYNLRVSLPLVTERTVGPIWNAVQDVGLFRLHQRSAWPKPMCARYEVELDFDGTRAFTEWESAARARLSRDELRRLYTRSHYRRILSHAEPDITPAYAPSAFELKLCAWIGRTRARAA